MAQDLTNKRFILVGTVASFSLLALYFGILFLAESFSHAIQQFSQLWYWILILVIGFGIQAGLYFFIRESFRLRKMKNPTAIVATSGGISTGSMIVCCLHHLTDVLPIIGLAAFSLFLIKYQVLFLVIGALSNFIGITIMLEIIQKNNLAGDFLKRFLVYDFSKIKKLAIGFSVVLFLITFFSVGAFSKRKAELTGPKFDVSPQIYPLPSQTNSQNGISFGVTPIDFNLENPIKFEIKIDTHSGSLDFDLAKISFLEDNKGNKYQPLDWQGSPLGGHHREVILIFPKLDNQPERIKLVIKDIESRIFEWNLR